MKRSILAVAAIAVASLWAGAASALVTVSANVAADTVWTTANSPYVLDKPIFVTSGATLTIEAGVIVRGQPRTGAVQVGVTAGTPGAIIVTQNGHANWSGSATAPIVFTTAAVDNDINGVADDLDANGFLDAYPGFDPADCPGACSLPGPGLFYDVAPTSTPLAPLDAAGNENIVLWGGMVILGNAPTNYGGDATGAGGYGTALVEGLTVPGFPAIDATYGGNITSDSSGVYRYLSVRHAGDEIGNSNELNGITLAGVGAGTVFEYIEVYCNFDDGIEWFGGTVNGNHLAVFFAGDDQFDLDQGYTGTNQYLFTIPPFFAENSGNKYGSKGGEKLGEWDGDDRDEGPGRVNLRADDSVGFLAEGWPQSDAQMYNLTAIGNTLEGGNDFIPIAGPAVVLTGINMRHGFGGALLNSVVINTGSQQGVKVDTGQTNQGYPDTDVKVGRDEIRVVSSTFHDGASASGNSITALANGDAAVPAQYNNSGTANVDQTGNFELVNEDITFNPQGTGNTGYCSGSEKLTRIDPRIDVGASDAGSIAGGVTTGPEAAGATFRGAFSNSGPLWTNGWTALSQCGVL